MNKLKQTLKKLIIKLTPKKLLTIYHDYDKNLEFATISYSQEGEDMVLKRFFEGKKGKGFYIDVGAHHPKKFSNTNYFYIRGWRGVNIDATPGSMKEFKKDRPEDINIEKAISDKKENLTYYLFNKPALNSFSKDISYQRNESSDYKIISQQKIQTSTLEEILDKHLAPNTEIDFMSIDVEGFDYKVLISNDWQKYRPQIVLIESLEKTLEEIEDSKITHFMNKQGYEIYAKTCNTIFFRKIN